MAVSSVASPDQVLRLLEIAAHQRNLSVEDANAAREQIRQWERQSGFYSTLQLIAQDNTLSPATRLLALTQLRSGVERKWKSVNHSIEVSEQNAIRDRLQQFNFDESQVDARIINQLSAIYAFIARRDFPKAWPSLFDDLITLYRSSTASNSPNRSLVALRIIQKIVAEFKTVRLAGSRKAYQEGAIPLFWTLAEDRVLSSVLSLNQLPAKQSEGEITHSLALLKCLRRLAIGALQEPHNDSKFTSIWVTSQEYLRGTMTSQHLESNSCRVELLKQIIKFHLDISSNHPVTFAVLKPYALIHFYWETSKALRDNRRDRSHRGEENDSQDELTDFICLRTLILLRQCFKIAYQTTSPVGLATSRSHSESAASLRKLMETELLTDAYCLDLFKDLISSYLVFMDSEIEEWTEESEEWELRENHVNDAFEHSVRSCAERLLLDVTIRLTNETFQLLLSLVEEWGPSDNIVVKDALLSALGISAARYSEKLDFYGFLATHINSDMAFIGSNANVLRRRIAIFLCQWTPLYDDVAQASEAPQNKARVYQIYNELLDPLDMRNDQVVRITAGKRLKQVVDSFGFEPEWFHAYTSSILKRLVDLIIESSLAENKVELLETLRSVVERMDAEVISFAEHIMKLLQQLWNVFQAEEHMKKSILSVLTALASSLREASNPMQEFVVPLLRQVLDPNSKENLNLLEDSIDLLNTLLKQSTAPANRDFLDVALDYCQFLDHVEESILCNLLDAATSLLCLAPTEVIGSEQSRDKLISLLTPLLRSGKRSVYQAAAYNLEIIFLALASFRPLPAADSIVHEIVKTDFSRLSMDFVLYCWASNQSDNPTTRNRWSDIQNETYILVVWARILQAWPDAFFGMVQNTALERREEPEAILNHVFEEWFTHLDHVADLKPRKAMALALTHVLEYRPILMFDKLQGYLLMWTSMTLELKPDEDDDERGDVLMITPEEVNTPVTGLSPHVRREGQLRLIDPVSTICFRDFVHTRLNGIVDHNGGSEMFKAKWLSTLDAEVVQQFMDTY